ncbi:MAG: hypothetical protein HY754_00885 [Nitrospirae bacterium]|nr:hypothetical protein [Nitrospirota bacterium]
MLAGLGYSSFTQLRYVAFFLIWAAPFISLALTPVRTLTIYEKGKEFAGSNLRVTLRSEGLRYICFLFSVVIIAVLIIGQREFDNVNNIKSFKEGRWNSNYFPEDVVEFIIKNNIRGNMYNSYEWGGYLIWRFYPEKKVFMDSRNLYLDQYLQYRSILNAAVTPDAHGVPYYKTLLENYRVGYMVIPLFTQAGVMLPIAGKAIEDKEWIPVFIGDKSVIFVKDTPENNDIIKSHSIPKDLFVLIYLRLLDAMIKDSPDDSCLYLAKGELYWSRRRFGEAREEYKKVLEINPFNEAARGKLRYLDGLIR